MGGTAFGISEGKEGVKIFLPPMVGYGYFLKYFMEDTPGGL